MTSRCGQRRDIGIVVAVLAVHVSLLGWSASAQSPCFHEIAHLPAGISHWRNCLFELYRVNPPLPRMVMTLPVLLFCEPRTDWSNYRLDTYSRNEFPAAIKFAQANGQRIFWIFTVARWTGAIFSVIGGAVCFLWANRLWGYRSGLISLLLWCFNPMILGHGALAMPDVPAASMGVMSCYCFYCWLCNPTWIRAAACGILLGLAVLCKLTLLAWFVLFPITWFLWQVLSRQRGMVSRPKQLLMGVLVFGIAIYTIDLVYAFRHCGLRLDDFVFQSNALTQFQRLAAETTRRAPFLKCITSVGVPLPRDYLLGIDHQRFDFERGLRSYLRGTWSENGWWYYHLYGWLMKQPLGFLGLVLLASVTTVCWQSSRLQADEVCLLIPAIGVLALVSSQTGFSAHTRYTLPALPLVIIWASKVGSAFVGSGRKVLACAFALLCWSTLSSLWVFPHSLSFFNELGGGPLYGHLQLLDSDFAWGQDLLFLRKWCDSNASKQPLHVAAAGFIDGRVAGVNYTLPLVGPNVNDGHLNSAEAESFGPQPGWFAIDVNFLHGTGWPVTDGQTRRTFGLAGGPNYEYFRRFEPCAHAGYSIAIYHITTTEANRARSDLGLPPLQKGIE